MTKLEEKLVAAVRNSLNLPKLKVTVRKAPGRWLFRLHHEGFLSDWLEQGPDDIRVIQQLGLLPAMHLGTFRVAFAALRRAAESRK